jgi:hypothetical protein
MSVADGHRKRISDVIRRRHEVKPKQKLDHLLNLILVSPAITYNSTLDFRRRVLTNRKTGFTSGQNSHAASVTELKGTTCISCVEQTFNRNTLWLALGQNICQSTVN